MKYEKTWVKLYRGKIANELVAASPLAFVLLYQIADRVQRTNSFNRYELDKGEALIGDFKSLKMTRGQYRYAKKYLEKNGFATFRTTNKGTIAKQINFDVFDPNLEGDDQQNDHPATVKQPAGNHPTTTTNNVKKENNAKNGKKAPNSSNGEMSLGVRAISLDNLIKEKMKEANEYKHQHRAEVAGGEYHWDPGTSKKHQQKLSKIKELKEDRESILLARSS
jgi:hypothetical protein